MKEQIVIHFDHQYIKAVMADREREAQRSRLVREAKQARSEKRTIEGKRRWHVSLRDPLKALGTSTRSYTP